MLLSFLPLGVVVAYVLPVISSREPFLYEGAVLHFVTVHSDALQGTALFSACAAHSGGCTNTAGRPSGGKGISPHVGGTGKLAHAHCFSASQPMRRVVSLGSATPQFLSPSRFTRTISVRPGKPNEPVGTSPSCGANWMESYPFSLAQNPNTSLSISGQKGLIFLEQFADRKAMASAWIWIGSAGVGNTIVRPVLYQTPLPRVRHAHIP
mmetsp:Transcript_68420/g.137595  ORF Transcript_68420/g.137595 Transcript_68420/m.137595 type:complete len:209 (+) Transcript_68420:135-761(+)